MVQNPGRGQQQAGEGQMCLCFSAGKVSLGRSLAVSQLPLEWGGGGRLIILLLSAVRRPKQGQVCESVWE